MYFTKFLHSLSYIIHPVFMSHPALTLSFRLMLIYIQT